ncbi:MAG: LysR family transcriptional regulator [Geminicoccaceae bacterium]|nr:LysR family transcriptional regulator [Geminicoccaceae bacterium]
MDLKRSDLGLLVSLEVLIEERSVTAAARRLGISQPALSAQLARLRDLFGDDLLVGNAHGMTTTPRAEQLRGQLGELLDGLRRLLRDDGRFDPTRDDRTVVITAYDLAHAIVIPPLLEKLRAQAPNLRLTALPLSARHDIRALERGEVDLVIASLADMHEGLVTRHLFDADFRLIWREGHPGVEEPLTLDNLCGLDHLIVSSDGGGYRGSADEALQRLGRTRRVVASLPTFMLVPPVIRSSDLVAIVPSRLALYDKSGLRSARLPFDLPGVPVHLGWHPRTRNDPAHRWLRSMVHG